MREATYFERQRAALIHAEFKRLRERLVAGDQVKKLREFRAMSGRLCRLTVALPVAEGRAPKLREVKIGADRLRRLYAAWDESAERRKAQTLCRDYKPTGARLHKNFIAHVHRLVTDPTGAASKHGVGNLTYVWDCLARAWRAGEVVPGIGAEGEDLTVRDWYEQRFPDAQQPDWDAVKSGEMVVDFPYHKSTVMRHARKFGLEARKLGNRDKAAANNHGYFIERDYSSLRNGELYTLDDVRLDLVVTHDASGQTVKCVAYIMMDGATRRVVAFLCKPEREVTQDDVAQLICHGLRTGGIGVGYKTKILLERGTAALGHQGDFDPHKVGIEAASGERIIILRTGMNEGVRLAGAHADAGSGNARGKSIIESFNRRLHDSLRHLPGQRGNHYDNQPASLGFTGDGKNAPGTVARAAQELAKFRVKYADANHRLHLHMPLLMFSELLMALREAIKAHNAGTGHDYTGHRTHTQEEISPGAWRKLTTTNTIRS